MVDDALSGSTEHHFHWSPGGIRPPSATPRTRPPQDDVAPPPSHDEQRNYPRIDLRVPIVYRILDGEPMLASTAVAGTDKSGHSDNISAKGACLMLAEKLAKGTVLALTIHLPEPRQKISAVARVVWSTNTDVAHHHLIGLEFITLYRNAAGLMEPLQNDFLDQILDNH